MKHIKRALLFCMALALVVSAVAGPVAPTVHAAGLTSAQTPVWSGEAFADMHPFTSTPELIQDLIEELRAQNITPADKKQDAAVVANVEAATNRSYEDVKNMIATSLKQNLGKGSINVADFGLDKNTMAAVLDELLNENYLTHAVSDLRLVTSRGEVTEIDFSVSEGYAAAMDAIDSEYKDVEVNADAQVAQDAAATLISTPTPMRLTRDITCTYHTVAADFIGDFNGDEEIDMFDLFELRDMILNDLTDWHQDVNDDGEVDMFDIFDLRDGILNDDLPSGEPTVDFEWAVTPDYTPIFRTDAEGNLLDADGNITEDPAQAITNGGLLYNPEDQSISEGILPSIYHKLVGVSFTCDVCGEEIHVVDDPETEEDELASLSMAQDIYINLKTYQTVACNVGETPVLAEGETMDDYLLYTEMQIGMYTDDTFSIMVNPETGEPLLDANDEYIPNVEMDESGNPVRDENGNVKVIGLFTSDAMDNGAQEVAYYYSVLSMFNADHADYFGVSTDFWTNKNTEANPMAALKFLCNMDPNMDVPPAQMLLMVQMLPQAFMAYVHYFGNELLAMRDAALEALKVLPGTATDIHKLLILHDWLAENAVFDMGSMLNVTDTGGNSDPIQMTTFGALLSNQLGIMQNSSYYGGICLAYAAAYTYLVQAAYPEIYTTGDRWATPAEVDENGGDIVDFSQVMFYSDTAETSVAGDGFGGGAFNNVHYFNAVRLENAPQDPNAEDGDMTGTWFYVDSCYDDIYIECIAQYRAEAEGSVNHNYFLVSPQTMGKMWADNIDYIDSPYDGYTYVPQVDQNGQVITPSDNIDEDSPEYDPNHPEYEKVEAPEESYNHNTCYEESWFSGAVSKIYTDGAYWYYVDSGSTASAFSDMLNDDGEVDFDMDQMMQNGFNMDTMMHSSRVGKDNQNKLKFRPMSSPDYWEAPEDENENSMMSGAKVDTYATVMFDYGTGVVDGVETVSEELLAAIEEDFIYREQFPSLTHTLAVSDGYIYFNLGNQIWQMETRGSEPVLFREYNTVAATSDNRPFKASSYTMDADGTDLVVENNPVAAICLRTAYRPLYNYVDAEGNIVLDYQNNFQNGYTYTDMETAVVGQQFVMMYGNPTITVNIGTNYSYTSAFVDGMTADEKSASIYTKPGINFNPDYTMGLSQDTANDNQEFLWCANIREDVALTDWAASTGAVDKVPCTAQIHGHSYKYNETEGVYICSACNLHAVNIVKAFENAEVALTTVTSSGMNQDMMGGMAGDQEISETTEAVSPEREGATTQSGELTITVTPDEGYGLPVVTYTVEGAEEATEVELTLNADGTYTGTVTKEAEGCLTFDVTLKEVVELTVTETDKAEVTVLANLDNITMAPAVEEEDPEETPEEEVTPDTPATAAEGEETEGGTTEGGTTEGEGNEDENPAESEDPIDPAKQWKIAEGETKFVPVGEKISIIVEPAEGFKVKNVIISTPGADGATVTTTLPANETNEYTHTVSAGPITVNVEFDTIYTVNIPEMENGTVTADKAEAMEGETVTLTVEAADGYQPVAEKFYVAYEVEKAPAEGETEPVIEVVKLELTAGEEENTCTFVMPAADVTVHAVFTKVYNVEVGNTITNGTVVADKETAVEGETVTLTLTPTEGYEIGIVSLIANGTTTTIEAVDGVYAFVMPAADVVINATFTEEIVEYNVTVGEIENGTVTADVAKAAADTVVTLTAEAADGYKLATLTVVGANELEITVTNGKFTMPASDVTVTATFIKVYTVVDETEDENGTVVVDKETAAEGEVVTLTVTADEGYELDELKVLDENGSEITVTDSKFTMPASNVTVVATFKEKAPATYNVNITTGENGTVVATPTSGVAGTEVTLDITPDEGYELDKLTYNGVEVQAPDNTFSFEIGEADVTITVTFKPVESTTPDEGGETGGETPNVPENGDENT